MRVESSKANQTNDKPAKTIDKSESVFQTTTTNSPISAPTTAPTTGAFEKIMKEARQESAKDEKTSKTENKSDSSETSDVKKEEKKDVKSKDDLQEREQGKGDGDGDGRDENGDENENSMLLASLGIFSNGKTTNENLVPAARSILHVADLERIVSTMRTIETKNSQQVLISLKNSVLEGLQIKLTVDENGKFKAEFLALNEKIREQINSRKNELSEILKNRGVKFQELNVRTFSESERQLAENTDGGKPRPDIRL